MQIFNKKTFILLIFVTLKVIDFIIDENVRKLALI